MTDERRRARAVARLAALTPNTISASPPSLEALRYGAPFFWQNAYADTARWAIALEAEAALPLPPEARACLLALANAPVTVESVVALAEASERAAENEEAEWRARSRCREIASRSRFAAAYLGHYPSACIALHECDAAANLAADDAAKKLLLVTRGELSTLASSILLATFDAKDRALRKGRRFAWIDLKNDSETVQFWEALGLEAKDDPKLSEKLLGPVRDDTGFDPRDPSFDPLAGLEEEVAVAPPPNTAVALSNIGPGLKPEAFREIKAAVGTIVGRHLPLTTVPASWVGFIAALDAEFPHFADVTRTIARLQGGRPTWGGLRVILLGAPGSGKTRYVRRLCQLAGLHLARIPCDASADNSAVAATPRRWQSGHPCRALAEMVAGGTANPVMLLDELGRASGSQQSNGGRLFDALIGQTDPENSIAYHDQFVEADADLSRVLWIATANDVGAVPAALLDRFVTLQCPIPGPEHLSILAPQVAREICRQQGLDEGFASLDATELQLLAGYWRGGSIRKLSRLVDAVFASREQCAPRH